MNISYRKDMALRGEAHPQHKLTESQVRMIRKLWQIGHRNIKVLARNNGVSTSNIRLIVKNKTWTHILFGDFTKYE
tara:strand:+ start:120 stop:347 length:228 start_codon:yes stop_codon:yes gene_type:complete